MIQEKTKILSKSEILYWVDKLSCKKDEVLVYDKLHDDVRKVKCSDKQKALKDETKRIKDTNGLMLDSYGNSTGYVSKFGFRIDLEVLPGEDASVPKYNLNDYSYFWGLSSNARKILLECPPTLIKLDYSSLQIQWENGYFKQDSFSPCGINYIGQRKIFQKQDRPILEEIGFRIFKDTSSGFYWAIGEDEDTSYEQAESFVNDLNKRSISDGSWFIPTKKQLQTLHDRQGNIQQEIPCEIQRLIRDGDFVWLMKENEDYLMQHLCTNWWYNPSLSVVSTDNYRTRVFAIGIK